MTRYLLDTNVFIEAYHRYYQEEIVPSFWKFLENNDSIYTVDKVINEIKDGKDELPILIENVAILKYTIEDFDSSISDYVNEKYTSEQSQKFLEAADFYLVCVAKNDGLVLVTQEKLLEESSKKVAIPNICEEFGVEYMDTFDMLKKLKINLSSYKQKLIQ